MRTALPKVNPVLFAVVTEEGITEEENKYLLAGTEFNIEQDGEILNVFADNRFHRRAIQF